MTNREDKAAQIAGLLRVTRDGDGWSVPSQKVSGRRYAVKLGPEKPSCTCPDFELRSEPCKHILAVQKVEEAERGGKPLEVQPPPGRFPELKPEKRTTYPQNWPAYNKAQTNEKIAFQALLHDLCADIEGPKQGRGRPRIPLGDMLFAMVFKVYSTFSGRRVMCDLNAAREQGFISAVPSYNSIFNYFENPALKPILMGLITASSRPLKTVEVDFAVDSTGFGGCRFSRWYDHRYGTVQQRQDWVKLHVMCGVKTNVVTAAEVTGQEAADAPQFKALVELTARHFSLSEVSADKGYSSAENVNATVKAGAQPFIAFKSNASGSLGGLWERAYHFYAFNRAEFLAHYHKRSNVESTVSMVKAKFRDSVRSKTDAAMQNEALAKVLGHNLCCLIQSTYELGIDPALWPSAPLREETAKPA